MPAFTIRCTNLVSTSWIIEDTVEQFKASYMFTQNLYVGVSNSKLNNSPTHTGGRTALTVVQTKNHGQSLVVETAASRTQCHAMQTFCFGIQGRALLGEIGLSGKFCILLVLRNILSGHIKANEQTLEQASLVG